MKIEVLGTGCPNCVRAYENVMKALEESGAGADVVKIEDINEIVKRGIMMTPAVIIDGNTVFSGKVPLVGELRDIISGK